MTSELIITIEFKPSFRCEDCFNESNRLFHEKGYGNYTPLKVDFNEFYEAHQHLIENPIHRVTMRIVAEVPRD